ncbi:MAG: hypothetical protein KC729_09030, partial [Candidatus Eisenbacteria bacterium]|nr:hypothetical protein [Candidatus Eisenbacteria bacterium]
RDYAENRDPAREAALACAADLRGDGPGAGSELDESVRAAPRSGLPRPSGDWTGLLSLGYEQIPVAVHFGDRPSADVPAEGGASDTWDVTLDLPSEDAFGLAVQDLEYDGGILRFGLDLGEIVPFEGRVNGARILGRFVLSGREWLFLLER